MDRPDVDSQGKGSIVFPYYNYIVWLFNMFAHVLGLPKEETDKDEHH